MKEYIILSLLLLTIAIPSGSSAQNVTTDVGPTPGTSGCVSLVYNMRFMSRDASTNGEVSTLQKFLAGQKYLNSASTGYFGVLTLKAVKDFQTASSIISTGFVGPLTRAKIKSMTCGSVPVPTGTVTVLSPNGGETWKTGTTKTITWDGTQPPCPAGVSCIAVVPSYDILLRHYYPPCTGNICPLMPEERPYTIAKNFNGFSYQWLVGNRDYDYKNLPDNVGALPPIPDGQYIVQICQTGTTTCDPSDNYFTIK